MKKRVITILLAVTLSMFAAVTVAVHAITGDASGNGGICGESYTEWSAVKPTGVAEALIETKTEYRSRTKQFTTAATTSLEGWTIYGTTTQWGPYDDWSEWSPTEITASESIEVETATIYGYHYYPCTGCGKRWPQYGSCWSNAGGCGAKTENNQITMWSDLSWDEAQLQYWEYGIIKEKYFTECFDDGIWYQWADKGQPQTGYRYRSRNLEAVYQYYRWTPWSDWSATPTEACDTVEVETRMLYRYLQKNHNYQPEVFQPSCTQQGYTVYTCSVCADSYISDFVEALGHDFQPAENGGACRICGVPEPIEVVSRNVAYTVEGNVITVTNPQVCKLGYWDENVKAYVEISCIANADGSYRFSAPAGVTQVLLVVMGDVDGNGMLEEVDNTLLAEGLLLSKDGELTDMQRFAADVNGNGKINAADRILIARSLLPNGHASHVPFAWNT